MNCYSRAYAAIDLNAILHNVQEMKRIIDKDTRIMAVIKTDGYGHGAVPIGRELEQLPFVWGYAVATVEEGVILRRNGLNKPILVLGASFPEQYETMARLDIRPNVFSLRMAKQMSETMEALGLEMKIHVKIDTGLSRLGFQVTEEAADEIAQIAGLSHIVLEGVFTHYAKSDAADKTMALKQLASFERMKELLRARNVVPKLCHRSSPGQYGSGAGRDHPLWYVALR